MQSVFQWIYGIFQSWYGQSLYKYLAGYNCEEQVTNAENSLFQPIGIWTLVVAIFLCVVYYYVINHPRFNRWWSWTLILALVGISSFILAFSWINSDYKNGDIMDCLITSESGTKLIDTGDIIMFGLVNLIISVIFYTIISAIIKWKSRNSKHSPI